MKTIVVAKARGARDRQPANFDLIESIVSESGLEIQVGGGICTVDVIERYLRICVRRVILGKALYVGSIDLMAALRVSNPGNN